MQPLAERVADDIRADAERLGGARGRRRRVGHRRRRRGAAATGDQQPGSQRARSLRGSRHRAGHQIYGEVDREARLLRLHVTDNGPGIDAAHRERIFRPVLHDEAKGTGLGLALVQKIVVTHNGRVHALPGPGGRGASMSVTLPLGSV